MGIKCVNLIKLTYLNIYRDLPIMESKMKGSLSDDEEELKALRLAALQTLKKKKAETLEPSMPHTENFSSMETNYKHKNNRGKKRFYASNSSRGRNVNLARNSNLISIPIVSEDSKPIHDFANDKDSTDVPKLIRPQDRYLNAKSENHLNEESSSKFDRYKDSSDSDEEDELNDDKKSLKKSNSLEALMEELENEIQGESKPKIEIEVTDKSADKNQNISNDAEVIVHVNEDVKEKDVKTENVVSPRDPKNSPQKNVKKHFIKRNNIVRKHGNKYNNFNNFHPHQDHFIPQDVPFLPVVPPTQVYNAVPSLPNPEIYPVNAPSPVYIPSIFSVAKIPPYAPPPVQPLIINTDPISNLPMGPLSPRSAAFVLENRAIVEKRKRSPRRSYSRSPSPFAHRSRYSKSPPPRKSLSPRRRPLSPRRSLSPRRHSRNLPRRSLSPKRSPKRFKESPPKRSKESPKRTKESRRTPLKERLGVKNKTEKNEKIDMTNKEVPTEPEIEQGTDPVLEARKRKFENKEIKIKEGKIRLKPNIPQTVLSDESVEESSKETPRNDKLEKPESIENVKETKANQTDHIKSKDELEDAMNELEMLLKDDEALELTAKVEDLFGDEDQEEKEGRFKISEDVKKEEAKVPKEKSLAKISKDRIKRSLPKNLVINRTEKRKEPLTKPIENPKIEIILKNSKKYNSDDLENEHDIPVKKRSMEKPEIKSKVELETSEDEMEIIFESDDEFPEKETFKEGDLRAQLSRKRAERQSKYSSVEGVPSRLLQNALEGAVFKKKKSKKKKEKDLSPTADAKLPIHYRLGLTQNAEIFAEATAKLSKKKLKKRKAHLMEQVYQP